MPESFSKRLKSCVKAFLIRVLIEKSFVTLRGIFSHFDHTFLDFIGMSVMFMSTTRWKEDGTNFLFFI